MNWIKNLFKPNDWHVVWAEQGEWTKRGQLMDRCYYEVYYSPSKNDMRLRIGGLDPKKHPMYPYAVEVYLKLCKSCFNYYTDEAKIEKEIKKILDE